jgi:hypothetical protein
MRNHAIGFKSACAQYVFGFDNGDSRTFKVEVCEQGDVIGAFFTLCQVGKDEEASPTLAPFPHTHTLDAKSNRIQITRCDSAGFYNANCAKQPIDEQDEGEYDAAGENPFRNMEGDLWFNLACPAGEGEKIDCGECVDSVDSDGDDDRQVEDDIREGCPT